MMRIRWRVITVLMIIAALLASCTQQSNPKTAAPSTQTVTASPSSAGSVLYRSTDDIKQFHNTVLESLGVDVKIMQTMYFQPDSSVIFDALSSTDPAKVEHYIYRQGKLSEPGPVALVGQGKLADNIFALKNVNLAAIPQIISEGEKIGNTVGVGSMTGPFTVSLTIATGNIRLGCDLIGPRGRGRVEANADGLHPLFRKLS